jgi:hypothetical protein
MSRNRFRGFLPAGYSCFLLFVAGTVLFPASLALATIGYDDCGEPPLTTTCFPYVTTHVHDLGAMFPSGTKIKVRYIPGLSYSCRSTVHISLSADNVSWSEVLVKAYVSGYGEYREVVTASQPTRYVKVMVPRCYADYSSASVLVEQGGTFTPVQKLDFGVPLEAGTRVTIKGTPGLSHGCTGSATIEASSNDVDWTEVGTKSYSSYSTPVPGSGWRDYKTSVTPGSPFRYLRVTHSHCFNDLSTAEVDPHDNRHPEYYALIIGGATCTSGIDRQCDPHYTWYWNVTSSMYQGLLDHYGYDWRNIYFLFEEDGAGGLDLDPAHIHDCDSEISNINEAIGHVANRIDADDQLYVFWVSHGSTTAFSLPGTDMTHAALATLVDSINGPMILALQPCHSGCAIDELSGLNRVIVTSVSCGEVNSSPWAETWRDGLLGAATMDDVGKIRISKAFEYAAALIQNSNEHPLIDDNGDGVGCRYDQSCYPNDDGQLARILFLEHFQKNLKIFIDGFETGDTSWWSETVP